MMYTNSNELYHHGIKGQRWGVRRFQNPDGTLTEAGKRREERKSNRLERRNSYSRGKKITKEKKQVLEQTFNDLRKNDEQYQRLSKELDRLVEKYGLDADDGGGGDTNRWSEKELEFAAQRYWNYTEDFTNREEELLTAASNHTNKYIMDKYGQMGVNDMQRYKKVNDAIAGGMVVATIAGSFAVKALQ